MCTAKNKSNDSKYDMIPGLVLFHPAKKKMQFLPEAGPNLEVVVLTSFETI